MKPRIEAALTAIVAAMIVVAETASAQTPGRVTRESVDSLGDQALGESGTPAVSADGRFVAFQSDAADLVPNDTNENTDVFVRDRQTGVVQRVSVAWNGSEARDDSMCPALSADGRYVAFRSRAWNLYPGGANLGNPRWDVYVHDRQDGTTTRISRSTTGGDPDEYSLCPSISGDGDRIVFSSLAKNLVTAQHATSADVFLYDRSEDEMRLVTTGGGSGNFPGDSIDPVISSDGAVIAFASTATDLIPAGAPLPPQPNLLGHRNVFAYDVATRMTELVSQAAIHPLFAPNEDSDRPALSADGRYVAFESWASNLLPQPPGAKLIYVRDRVGATTSVAGAPDTSQRDCGTDGQAFCGRGSNRAPAISADGRFVAFSSGSDFLLPKNLQPFGSSIYLFDRLGGRLRRLSVDASGWAGEACSEEPSISADGKLVAYRTASTTLVPGDTNAADDVISNDWTCNDAGSCRVLAACPAEPLDCAPATESVFRLSKNAPGGVKEDSLFWRWSGDAAAGPFPDPAGTGQYQLCVYGKSLALDVAAPDAPACAGSERPCWRTLTGGYRLLDPEGGLTSLRITATSGVTRILANGAGSLLDAPYLPLLAPNGIVVQLQETGTGQCWGADYPASSIKRNTAGLVKMGSMRDGRLVARFSN